MSDWVFPPQPNNNVLDFTFLAFLIVVVWLAVAFPLGRLCSWGGGVAQSTPTCGLCTCTHILPLALGCGHSLTSWGWYLQP